MKPGDIVKKEGDRYLLLSNWEDDYVVICPVHGEKPQGEYELSSKEDTLIVWASHSLPEAEVEKLPLVKTDSDLAKEGWKVFRSWMLGEDVEMPLKQRLGEAIDDEGAEAHQVHQDTIMRQCGWIYETW
jgi:hypothetical protein